jgi:NADH-quinone oxidoreductase subunit D
VGQTISDATLSLAAADPCYCCTERMAYAFDTATGKKIYNGNELLALSQSKTEAIKKQIKSKL